MDTIKNLFRIGSEIPPKTGTLLSVIGWIIFPFGIWWLITALGWVNPFILPSPQKVFQSYGILFSEKNLVYHTGYSISINLLGYLQAVAIAVPVGFLIGLVPIFREMIMKQIEAVRFTPLPATTAIFMTIFGIGLNLKIQFLGFGIFVYLLPSIVQRIDEIKTNDHLKALQLTMKTMNASTWQTLKHFYFPSVLSRFFPDIINLVAVSWTYIVIAELMNAEGGLGFLINRASGRGGSHIEQVYAVIILIIVIGVIQDRLLKLLDKKLFKFKYA
ncbi:MAG: ABC transporter permease subunit [Candidatus Peribacteria bacterium]|jgi:NitT/TauT family transport system permease protein|nr:ABC transporter permease subunit [Candidatus Peribacteria bacterium]